MMYPSVSSVSLSEVLSSLLKLLHCSRDSRTILWTQPKKFKITTSRLVAWWGYWTPNVTLVITFSTGHEEARGGHMRIDVPPSHRYQALLAVHAHANWGEQRTMQQVKKVFLPMEEKRHKSLRHGMWSCLHREEVNFNLSRTVKKRQWHLVPWTL